MNPRGRQALAHAVAVAVALALVACREERHLAPPAHVDPPVTTPQSIPEGPVSGRIHGAPFTMRDARYVVDKRVAYAHTDILLSSGSAESPCAPAVPAQSTTVWLRLEGPGRIAAGDARTGPGQTGAWRVHYQVFDGEAWSGVGDGSALVSLAEPGPDGRLSGGLAVCFPDETKSCVAGSFDAVSCPPSIDQPVRGTPPPEAVPPQYRERVSGAR
jgi:hypothetical protein